MNSDDIYSNLILVGGLFFLIVPYIVISSQLTLIFFRGVGFNHQPPTRYTYTVIYTHIQPDIPDTHIYYMY